MSLIYAAVSHYGIVFSSDSRLVYAENNGNLSIVTDKAQKLFRFEKFILGHTGSADILYDGRLTKTYEVINEIEERYPDCTPDEFLDLFREEVRPTMERYHPELNYEFLFDAKIDGRYAIRYNSISNFRIIPAEYTFEDDCGTELYSVGKIDVAFTKFRIPPDMTIDQMNNIQHCMLEKSIEVEQYINGERSVIGGTIQTISFT